MEKSIAAAAAAEKRADFSRGEGVLARSRRNLARIFRRRRRSRGGGGENAAARGALARTPGESSTATAKNADVVGGGGGWGRKKSQPIADWPAPPTVVGRRPPIDGDDPTTVAGGGAGAQHPRKPRSYDAAAEITRSGGAELHLRSPEFGARILPGAPIAILENFAQQRDSVPRAPLENAKGRVQATIGPQEAAFCAHFLGVTVLRAILFVFSFWGSLGRGPYVKCGR